MTTYVLLYTGGKAPETEQEMAEVLAAWSAWYEAMGEAVTDGGNPFGHAMQVDADGVHEGPGMETPAAGYTVITAESLEEAAAKCVDHPHISYGGKVSVYETYPIELPT